jgi:hypothetical protein
MKYASNGSAWWTIVTVRVIHASLNPFLLSTRLGTEATYYDVAGESSIVHGECNSSGYWTKSYRIDAPELPDVAIAWADNFINNHLGVFAELTTSNHIVDIFVGVHSKAVALGFMWPHTPNIDRLNIPIGIDYYMA